MTTPVPFAVFGYAEADDAWQRMLAAYHACRTAGVPVPAEVLAGLRNTDPEHHPAPLVDISAAVAQQVGASSVGAHVTVDIDLTQIPEGTRRVRVVTLGFA